MDRRDALKKLGMGGATVVGATMVMSSPAFAIPGTPGCADESVTLSISASQQGNGGQTTAVITFTATASSNCPCTTNPPGLTVTSSSVTNDATGVTTVGTGATVGPLGNDTYSYTLSVRASCLDGGNVEVCSSGTVSGPGGLTVSGQSQPGPLLTDAVITFTPASC